MAGSALENAIQEIRKYSKISLQDAYFKDIYVKVKNNPEDVRFTEQLRLSDYYLKLLEFAQGKVEAALEKDGVKWQGLVWEEHINEKIQQPEFHYCTVHKKAYSDDALQKELPPFNANSEKFLPRGTGTSAAVFLLGSFVKLAGGKGAVISTAGTVLMIVGAAGLACCLVVGVAGSGKGKVEEVVKGKEGNPTQGDLVNLKELLESQVVVNAAVIDKWIDDLASYARQAEDIAEKA